MNDKENALQEAVEELLCDPDKDAERTPHPNPPQTIANEPTSEREER